MKTSFKKQISTILKGPGSPVRRSMVVTDDETVDEVSSKTLIKSRSFMQETTLSSSINRTEPITMRSMKKSASEDYEDFPSPGSTPPSYGTPFKGSTNFALVENDTLDDIISLQNKLLQALSTIKTLKKEKADVARSAAARIEKLEKREKELKDNFIKISNEECSQLLYLIDQGHRLSNASLIDQRMIQQTFAQLEEQIVDYQELLTNPATPSPEYSNSPSSPLLSRSKTSDKERIKHMEIIGDLEEELEMSKFTNNLLRQAQIRIEEECKTLESINTSLRQTNEHLQLELSQLKSQAQNTSKARPASVFEKMLEELRENLSHEIKEKERWKRYYIESSEEMEELKEELNREERIQSRLRKENADLESELEEQAVIFEKCRELDVLVRKKFSAQMDEMENTLKQLKGEHIGIENFAILSKMRSHDKSYGELLLKHEEDYKREYQERVRRREELLKKEEEEIRAKRTEFKSRPMFDQVQQKIRSFQ